MLGCCVVGWFGCLLVVGLLGCWVVGLMGCWIVELDCWIVGLLVCCSVGLLVCWSVAVLVCWILNPARRNARSDPPPLACKGARRAGSLPSSSGFLALAWSSCRSLGPALFLYPSWGPSHRPAHAARPHLQDHPFRRSAIYSPCFACLPYAKKSLKNKPSIFMF